MVDFVGQRRLFWGSAITLLIATPISFVVAFVLDNFLYALYTIIAVGGLLMILFVPDWPWLSLNPEQWRNDLDFYNIECHLNIKENDGRPIIPNRIISHTETPVRRSKGIPRNVHKK